MKTEKLIECDCATSHSHDDFKDAARNETNSMIAYVPPGCTSFVAPVDGGPGKWIKAEIKKLYHQYSETLTSNEWENG